MRSGLCGFGEMSVVVRVEGCFRVVPPVSPVLSRWAGDFECLVAVVLDRGGQGC